MRIMYTESMLANLTNSIIFSREDTEVLRIPFSGLLLQNGAYIAGVPSKIYSQEVYIDQSANNNPDKNATLKVSL